MQRKEFKNLSSVAEELLRKAWEAREFARPWRSRTKVGCAILTSKTKQMVQGWNIEGLWMTSIHAEACAIIQLAKTKEKGTLVAIASETEFFTPCGSCLDWLFQFCDLESAVLVQNRDRKVFSFELKELCPWYPKQ